MLSCGRSGASVTRRQCHAVQRPRGRGDPDRQRQLYICTRCTSVARRPTYVTTSYHSRRYLRTTASPTLHQQFNDWSWTIHITTERHFWSFWLKLLCNKYVLISYYRGWNFLIPHKKHSPLTRLWLTSTVPRDRRSNLRPAAIILMTAGIMYSQIFATITYIYNLERYIHLGILFNLIDATHLLFVVG